MLNDIVAVLYSSMIEPFCQANKRYMGQENKMPFISG